MSSEYQEEKVTRGDVRRFLQRRRGLYPSGVPVSLLVGEPLSLVRAKPEVECVPLEGTSTERVVVLFTLPGGLSAESRALLHSAVEKGMKLHRTQVAVSEGIPEAIVVQALFSLKAIVYCGVPCNSGRDTKVFQCETHALDAVASDAAKKRDFWTVLKNVIVHIEKKESVA